MTLRLTDEQAAALAALAAVDEMPVSRAVREAIDDRIRARRDDPEFQASLARAVERNQRALELLR